ncbi:hypothetical protein BSKO_11170 [Bryopsis sp. KO-2023]|nr:hypothetical protein BSKO_11170 [Bryopsis sp. KO-2023]
MADEVDFIELVIASERVGQWIETVKESHHNEKRVWSAVKKLEESVVSSEAYAEEAVLGGVVPLLVKLLERDEHNEEFKGSMSKIIEVCSGARTAGGKVSCFEYGEFSVVVKEGSLSDGLGARMWEIAHMINRYLVANRGLVSEKKVLEIGCGCGSTGILAAKLGAKKVVLTDCVDSVLQNLRDCVHLNAEPVSDHINLEDLDDASTVSDLDFDELTLEENDDSLSSSKLWDSSNMSVRYLDWSESLSHDRHGGKIESVSESDAVDSMMDGEAVQGPEKVDFDERFDVVIGTDVMYEVGHSELVAAVISHRLASGGRCLISGAVRDQGVHDKFVQECQTRGLRVEIHKIPTPERMKAREYEGGFIMMAVDWAEQPSWKDISWKPDPSSLM